MAYDPMNPFGLPSLGASGASQNPLLSSMDMMRQAMTGLGQSAQASSGSLSQPMTPEDLEQKINDLKVVENWLKLNLSMLSSSIQGLEVQLATVRTLRSFVAMGETPAVSSTSDASPLEVALGLKPAPTKAAAPREASTGGRENETQNDVLNKSLNETAQKPPSGDASAPDANTNTAAAQAWWKMLENQFNQLASATTQANAAAQSAMADAAASGAKKATKAAAKKASQVATKTAKKAANKAATRSATEKSTPASRTRASRG